MYREVQFSVGFAQAVRRSISVSEFSRVGVRKQKVTLLSGLTFLQRSL
jgi:hypothetical protein